MEFKSYLTKNKKKVCFMDTVLCLRPGICEPCSNLVVNSMGNSKMIAKY